MKSFSQKGLVPLAVIVGILILLGTVATAFLFARKASLPQGPVEPPDTEITFQKSFNLISVGPGANPAYIKEMKNLGANMITIFWAATISRESGFPNKTRVAQLIAEAHRQGLQVEIRNSFSAEGDPISDFGQYKQGMLNFAVDLAGFAQENKVYRLAPFSEIDNNLLAYPNQIEPVAQEILREVRKHYRGQVGIGLAAPWRGTSYNFKGYDYMSVSVYVQRQTSVEDYFEGRADISLQTVLGGTRAVAQRSGIDTLIIGETGVFNPGEERWTAFETKIMNKEEEAGYYQTFFEATADQVQGYSPPYFGYMGVQNDPAAEVVKQWYGRL